MGHTAEQRNHMVPRNINDVQNAGCRTNIDAATGCVCTVEHVCVSNMRDVDINIHPGSIYAGWIYTDLDRWHVPDCHWSSKSFLTMILKHWD